MPSTSLLDPVAATATRALSAAELARVVQAVADDDAAWQPHVRLPAGTKRWWTRLPGDDVVDLWLLSWLPGHSTELHDHGASSAAFTVVRGQLGEMRVQRNGRLTAHRRPAGSTTALDPGVIHDVYGAGNEVAVSIHAYSRPLTRMNYYRIGSRRNVQLVRSVRTVEPETEADR